MEETKEEFDKMKIKDEEKKEEKPQCGQSKKKRGKKKWRPVEARDLNFSVSSESSTQAQSRSNNSSASNWNSRSYPANTVSDPNDRKFQTAVNSASVYRDQTEQNNISRFLAAALRHGKPRINIDPKNGYASVNEILTNQQFVRKFGTVEPREIRHIVESNSKKRFELENIDGDLKIRATQGHSIQVDVDLVEITDPNEFQTVVHGTYKQNWKTIKTEGLSKLQRQHIHFAPGLIGQTHVTSGMRSTCDIIIHLDMKKAMEGGIRLYKSSNNVILTEGNAYGFVLPKFFKKVQKYNQKTQSWADEEFDA